MCATFQFKKQVFKPGKNVVAVAESGIVEYVWVGFARAEISPPADEVKPW